MRDDGASNLVMKVDAESGNLQSLDDIHESL
jgi:hypothetical protein